MHQCVNVNISNFTTFGPVFMKFSPNCRVQELGMLFNILGSFRSFMDWEGARYSAQNRPMKIPDFSEMVLLSTQSIH